MSLLPIQPASAPPPPPVPVPNAVRAPDPFNAAPGSVPFFDFLRATNETHRSAPHQAPAEPTDTFERSNHADAWDRPCPDGTAKLGEVPPASPTPAPSNEQTDVRVIQRVMSPIGAMIDLTA